MKFFFYIIVFTLLGSCASIKHTSVNTSEDKALLTAIKKLNKSPDDAELKKSIVGLYNDAAKIHLDKIDVYNSLTDLDRWDKIVAEYEALNKLNELISTSAATNHLLKTSSYSTALLNAKQTAASEYYDHGISLLNNNDKESARNAYYDFKKADGFVAGFKDSRQKMDIAYKNSIIHVVINPVRDYSFNNSAISINSFYDNFQRNLVRDLGGSYNKNNPQLFYTDREAERENIQADFEVDLTWANINIPPPSVQQSSGTIRRQIAGPKDTSGKVQYEWVSGTLTTVRKYCNISGNLEIKITNLATNKMTTLNEYQQYVWERRYEEFSGDDRALEGGHSGSRFNNANRYSEPREDEVLYELTRRIYPQLKNRIYNSVRR